MSKEAIKIIPNNKKAYHEYFVLEKLEAGIELVGTEVKSIRAGRVNLKESWCMIKNGEIFVNGMHISPYEQGNIFNKDPFRVRKLLMHRKEIDRLFGKIKQDGLTLIPTSVYFKNSSNCNSSSGSASTELANTILNLPFLSPQALVIALLIVVAPSFSASYV